MYELRLFQKYQMKTFSLKVIIQSNFFNTDCKCSSIYHIFKLIGGIFPDFSSNIIHKNIRCSKTVRYKFWFDGFVLKSTFVFLPIEKSSITREWYYKKNIICIFNSSYNNIVFVLLTDIIILHVDFLFVWIHHLIFKNSF